MFQINDNLDLSTIVSTFTVWAAMGRCRSGSEQMRRPWSEPKIKLQLLSLKTQLSISKLQKKKLKYIEH